MDEAFFGTFLFFLSFLNPKMGISKPQIFLVMQVVKTLVFKRRKKKAVRNRYDLLFFFYYGVQNSPHLATLFQNQNKLLFKTLSFDEFLKSYTKISSNYNGKT